MVTKNNMVKKSKFTSIGRGLTRVIGYVYFVIFKVCDKIRNCHNS